MATHTFSSIQMIDTLENYLSWTSGIEQGLANIGLVRTNDTGQTDFIATVFTVTGTQLTSNVATYTCTTTAGMRIGQSLVIAGLPSDGAVYNRTATVTAMTATTFNVAITNANIAYTDNSGTATVSIATGVPASLSHQYQIWRFNDALQSTMPVYIKLGFGKMSVTGYTGNLLGPYLYMQVGTGSNGSGTLTGATTLGNSTQTMPTTTSYTMQNASSSPSYISGSTNRMSMFLWRGSNWSRFYTIERTKDMYGDDTADGVQVAWCQGVQTTTSVVSWYRGFEFYDTISTHYTSTEVPCIGTSASSTLYNGKMTIFPLFNPFGGIQYPMTTVMSGRCSDFTEALDFQYSIYDGLEMTFIAFTLSSSSGVPRMFGAGSTGAILMRWE